MHKRFAQIKRTTDPATRGWYTPVEVAAEFGVETQTVLGWIALGHVVAIPPLIEGGPMRIPVPALNAYKRRRGMLPPLPRSISPGHRHDLTGKIVTDPDIQGGMPVFVGSRVPVEILRDYIESGKSLDDFLAEYPSVDAAIAAEVFEAFRSG